jgi:YggT family protein
VVGGAGRDRTADLLIANEALSQLSYGPNRGRAVELSARYRVGIYGAGWGESRIPQFPKDMQGDRRTKRRSVGLFGGGRAGSFPAFHRGHRSPMRSILYVILLVLDLYIWLLIAAAVLSWLVAFNVVNTRNQVVAMLGDFLYRITEPVLRPIRNMLPSLGGIDVSPVVLILIIILIKDITIRYIYPNVL